MKQFTAKGAEFSQSERRELNDLLCAFGGENPLARHSSEIALATASLKIPLSAVGALVKHYRSSMIKNVDTYQTTCYSPLASKQT